MIFLRYLSMTGVAYAIDLGCFLILLSLHLNSIGPILASVTGKLISSIFSFAAHRYFTFKHQINNSMRHQAWRYFLLVAINTQFSAFILMMCLHWIHTPIIAKIITDIFCVIVSYWLSKTFIFIKSYPSTSSRI